MGRMTIGRLVHERTVHYIHENAGPCDGLILKLRACGNNCCPLK